MESESGTRCDHTHVLRHILVTGTSVTWKAISLISQVCIQLFALFGSCVSDHFVNLFLAAMTWEGEGCSGSVCSGAVPAKTSGRPFDVSRKEWTPGAPALP